MNGRVYFDHAATAPLALEVCAAMAPFLGPQFGNPSSLYTEGRVAREAVDVARGTVAAYFGAQPDHVVFTRSGTEASNLAIRKA